MRHEPGWTRWRGLAAWLAAVAACGLLVAIASARTPKPPLCTTGRFLVPASDPPLFAGVSVSEVELRAGSPPQVVIRGGCPAVRVRLKATRRGTTLLATWAAGACGVPGKVRLKGTIVDLCQTLTGTLKKTKSR